MPACLSVRMYVGMFVCVYVCVYVLESNNSHVICSGCSFAQSENLCFRTKRVPPPEFLMLCAGGDRCHEILVARQLVSGSDSMKSRLQQLSYCVVVRHDHIVLDGSYAWNHCCLGTVSATCAHALLSLVK